MSYRVILHRAAEKEYLSSYLWYEERSKGLGERFFQAIDAVFILCCQQSVTIS